jgi:hypothetical protein
MPPTAPVRTGLVIAALLGVGDVVATFFPTPDGEVGPPLPILLLGAVLGVVTIAAAVVAWRGGRRGRPTEEPAAGGVGSSDKRGALRIVAGTRVLSAITALPAFFVEIPPGLKLAAAVGVVLTVVCVVLLLAPAGRRAPLAG